MKSKTTKSGRSRRSSKKSNPLLKKADKLFSDKIRMRDGRCLHPRCICFNKKLQCSHYFRRSIWSVRFDPDNCITLGWRCHFKDKDIGFEYQKQRAEVHGFDGQYTIFMKQWLGDRFAALEERAKEKVSKKEAIRRFLESVDNLLT